ncbi:MAG: signal recognition particle protein, partial [Anaerolineales bacterium]
YRPAAVQQLQQLGAQLNLPVESGDGVTPAELARRAVEKAAKGGYSVVILDTAGRSQIDPPLMDELRQIAQRVSPREVLLVVDAMIGQEALQVAQGFREVVPLTGLILTKMDGDARGGAAISIRSVTGIPIKFLGTGEKTDALEAYDPQRLASRILGMGDVLGLIEKAEAAFDAQQAQRQAERLMRGEFSLEDWLEQMRQLKKMGPLAQILEMLPGQLGQAARQVNPQDLERNFKRFEAIILSMTPEERRNPDILNASRRRRIARGAGTEVQDVNRLIKQYREAQRLFKSLQKGGGRGLSRLFG